MPKQIKSEPKSLISNSFWSMSLTIWQIAVTFFLTPFLVKELGVEFYGLLILLLTISGFMGIMNFGLGDTTLRYIAYYYGKNDIHSIKRIISNTFFIFTIISFISFSILFLFSENIVNLLINDVNENKSLFIDLVQITAVTIAINFMGGAFGTVSQALQRYDITTKINIINSILYVVGTVFILYNHGTIKELVLWNLINTVILQFMNIIVAKYLISEISIFPKFDKETFKEVFGFSFFTFLTNIFALIQNHSDKLLTSSMINASSLAYLAIPQQLTTKGSQLVDSLGSVLLPKFSTIEDKNIRKELFINSTWYLLIISSFIYVPLTILIPDFFTLWIDKEFSEKSSFLAQIIVSSFIISGPFPIYAALFNSIGKPQYITVTLSLIAVFTLVINYILISNYGFSGLGYAFWIVTLIKFLTLIFTWYKVLDQNTIVELFKIYLFPALICFIYTLLNVYYFENYINIYTWYELFFYAISIVFILAILLISIEFIFNKKSKRLIKIIEIIKGFKK